MRAVCEGLGVKYATVWRRCKELGLPLERRHRRPARRPSPPAEQIAAKYRAGTPARRLADEYKTTESTVRKWLIAAGVETRSYAEVGRLQRVPTPPVEDIAQAYRAGESLTEVAERFGLTKDMAVRRLAEAGIDRRGPKEAAALRERRRREDLRGLRRSREQSQGHTQVRQK